MNGQSILYLSGQSWTQQDINSSHPSCIDAAMKQDSSVKELNRNSVQKTWNNNKPIIIRSFCNSAWLSVSNQINMRVKPNS